MLRHANAGVLRVCWMQKSERELAKSSKDVKPEPEARAVSLEVQSLTESYIARTLCDTTTSELP